MKPFSKMMFGFWSALVGGAIVFATVQLTSLGRETNALPEIKVESSAISRDTRGVTSYASIVKRVAPSVVNIYSTRTIHEREMNPFSDPFFRHFFGPPDNQDQQDQDQGQTPGQRPGNRGRRRSPHSLRAQSLGSGVIISS